MMISVDEIPADAPFAKKNYVLAASGIALLRFLLESYDGLAFVRTLDPGRALVEIAYPPGRRTDAEALLRSLEKEIGMVETVLPADFEVAPL